MSSTPLPPRAHPYTDLAVIDERGPRTNQVFVGVTCLVAFVLGWWWLVALVAAQLAVSLLFGRRWCLPCRLWFDVLQKRLGEGRLEDARAPRFANQIGLGMLALAGFVRLAGWPDLAWSVVLVISALALVSAVTGFCVGCAIYRLARRCRGDRCEVRLDDPRSSDPSS